MLSENLMQSHKITRLQAMRLRNSLLNTEDF